MKNFEWTPINELLPEVLRVGIVCDLSVNYWFHDSVKGVLMGQAMVFKQEYHTGGDTRLNGDIVLIDLEGSTLMDVTDFMPVDMPLKPKS